MIYIIIKIGDDMENAINMYTNMVNFIWISSLIIILIALTITILIRIKYKKESKILCIACGNKIDKDSKFCKYCGINQTSRL